MAGKASAEMLSVAQAIRSGYAELIAIREGLRDLQLGMAPKVGRRRDERRPQPSARNDLPRLEGYHPT